MTIYHFWHLDQAYNEYKIYRNKYDQIYDTGTLVKMCLFINNLPIHFLHNFQTFIILIVNR